MKKSNLAVALFSCALLSTTYVTSEMGKITSTNKPIHRTIASEQPVPQAEVQEVKQEEDKPFYVKWREDAAAFGDRVSDIWNGVNLVDLELTVRPSVLQEKLDKMNVEYEALAKDKVGIEAKLKEEEKKVADLEDELKRTNEQTSIMVNQLLDDQEATGKVHEAEKKALSEKANKLAKALEAKNEEVGELKMALAQFDDIKKTMDALKQTIADLQKENQELKDENQRLTCLLEKQNDLEEQIKKLTDDKEAILAKLKEQTDEEEKDEVVADADSQEKEEEKPEEKAEDKEEEKVAEKVEEKEEEKEEEKVAESKVDKDDNKGEDKEETVATNSGDLMNMVNAFFAYQAQMQQQNDMYRLQMSLAGQRDQRSFMTDLTTFDGGSSFLNSQLMMMKEIEMMRMRSSMIDRYRFDAGGFFGQEDYNGFNSRRDSIYGLNTGRNMSFHDSYIKDQPMRYSPSSALPVSSFNPDRAYNFGLNVSPNFAETPSWQGSSVSFN